MESIGTAEVRLTDRPLSLRATRRPGNAASKPRPVSLTPPLSRGTLGPLTIRLNGEPVDFASPLTIAELLARLDIDPRRVAVEHNQVVVRKPAYETTVVGEGDEVEIVNFVGGGVADA